MQLDKAQDAFTAWQNASKGSSERRRLQPEIEEECKSIAWQVKFITSFHILLQLYAPEVGLQCATFTGVHVKAWYQPCAELWAHFQMFDTAYSLTESKSTHLFQVDEMEKAVDVAEKNMNRFGLTTQEIRSRRQWVHDTRRTVSYCWLCLVKYLVHVHLREGDLKPLNKLSCTFSSEYRTLLLCLAARLVSSACQANLSSTG